MTFQDASQLLLIEAQSRHLSTQTIRFYRQRLNQIGRMLENKNVRSVTAQDCRMVQLGWPMA